MSGWLVDDRGDLWPQADPRLRARLGSQLPTVQFASYAVASLGFVRIAVGARGLQLAWRPTILTGATYAGLNLALKQYPASRVTVATLKRNWSYRLCGSVADAVCFLSEVFRSTSCDGEGHFEARRRPVDSLARSDHLDALIRTSVQAGHRMTALTLWKLLETRADGRYVLAEADGERGPLRVLGWGRGYRRFQSQWAKSMTGHAFEDQPDRAYAHSAAIGYRRALQTREPIVEDIAASTWWPGNGRVSVSYTRLLLPIEIARRGPCVLCRSQAAQVVEPCFERHHERA